MMQVPGLDARSWRLENREYRSGLLSNESSILLQDAVLKTLAYAAVFNYPLTKEEIWKYLIGNDVVMPLMASKKNEDHFIQGAINCTTTILALKFLQERGLVGKKDGYYYLRGMELSVEQRKRREKIAQKKFAIAEKFCEAVKYIPTVKLIGVSGALAMQNAHEEDDIDLFVVASAGAAWTTRFFTIALAELLGVRRRPSDTEVKDKICLNMFVDERHMSVPRDERDLFSAHEVVQMRPLYDAGGVYGKFLHANRWVSSYLPNAVQIQNCNSKFKINFSHITHHTSHITDFVEKILKIPQLFYMYNKVTNEVLKPGYLRFHPVDARRFVLRRYRQILANLP